MKVLHVIANIGIGGINRFVIDLVKAQKQTSSIEVGVYILNSSKKDWYRQLEEVGVECYFDNIPAGNPNWTIYRKFRKVKRDYDIIHWHNYAPIAMSYSFGDGKKHVFTHHSIIGGFGRKNGVKEKVRWAIFKFLLRTLIDQEIYNSRFTERFWREYGLGKKRSRLIYNGANFSKIVSNEQDDAIYERANFIVGTCSNFNKLKRVDMLVMAFGKWYNSRQTKPDACLLLIGDGIERERLVQLTNDLNISDRVIFAGHQSNPYKLIKSTSLGVFPSIGETFGLAPLEYLANGVPVVVSTESGGATEILNDPKETFTSIDELADQLERFYSMSEGERNVFSIKCAERATNFDMNLKALEYIQEYSSLLK